MTVMRLGLTALVLGITVLAPPHASSQPVAETLRLSGSLVDGVTPVLYADRAGLFRQAGLTVTLERAATGAATAAAVVGGSIDIGESNIMSIVAAHAHGVPLVMVAPAAIYDPRTPDAALLVAAGSAIRSARDLGGKVVGITNLSDLSTIATEAWMDAEHADWHAIQTVELTLPQMEAALDAGRVQAIVLIKPFLTDAVASGKARMLAPVYGAIADRFLESGWFARRDYVETHRDLIATFARIVAQASVYTNAHHAQTSDLLAAWAGIDAQRAARVPRGMVGTTLEARDIQPVIEAAARYGAIAKTFPATEIMAQ